MKSSLMELNLPNIEAEESALHLLSKGLQAFPLRTDVLKEHRKR